MSFNQFKASVWKAELKNKIDEKAKNAIEWTNRSFEGAFKNVGDEVVVCGAGDVKLKTALDGQELIFTDDDRKATSVSVKLRADKSVGYSFFVPNIDKAQGANGQVATYTQVGGEKAAVQISKDIYAAYVEPTVKTITKNVTNDTALEPIDEAIIALKENGIFPDSSQIKMSVSPAFMSMIENADIKKNTNNSKIIESGGVKSYKGIMLDETNLLFKDSTHIYVPVRTQRALAHNSVVSETTPFDAKPTGRFGDGIMAQIIYGNKVVFPKEVVLLKLKLS